jgi:hypothetical protein
MIQMSTTATPTAPALRPSPTRPALRRRSTPVHPARVDEPTSGPPVRGGTTLFEVPFASPMSDLDLALLARTLDLSTRRHAKMHPRRNSPGFARLDHHSGLFLELRAAEGQWMLQARTWGHPAPQSVHEWHVLAAGAAHRLDPTVTLPEPLSPTSAEIPDRPLGQAANKRLARIRRHMVGLP